MSVNIVRFVEPETKTQTYLVYSKENNALIIDPVYGECDKYLKALEQHNLNLVFSMDTHIHADHITGSGRLREATGCKIVMGAQANISLVDIKLNDQEEFYLDDLIVRAIYTPGHTIESYCYLIDDKLFTGDCLLINACGRTDFQGGSAYQQYDSLFNRVLALPPETVIYPGHDYNNRTVSTLLEEKSNNPRLQVKNADDFVNVMSNLNLPRPKYIDIAVPRNLNCGLEI